MCRCAERVRPLCTSRRCPAQAHGTLYYEVLEMPLQILESKKSLRVSWHNQAAEETVRAAAPAVAGAGAR